MDIPTIGSMEQTDRSEGPQSRDPAASMSLLTQLLRNPLDAGYHAYAADSHNRRLPPWRRVVIAVAALALGFASAAGVSALREPDVGEVETSLVDQARTQQAAVQRLDQDTADLAAEIQSTADALPPVNRQLEDDLAVATAETAVDGPGLSVTLGDRADSALEAAASDGQVTDQDLRVVINALWSGGAEAVSVNGLRIGPGTFVRTAGTVVLVNVTTVQSPYTVTAIGDSDDLSVALVRGTAGDYLSAAQSARRISVTSATGDDLHMDALDARTTRYVSPIDSESSGG